MRDDQAKRSQIVTHQHPLSAVGSKEKTEDIQQSSRESFLFIFGWLVGWVDACRKHPRVMSQQAARRIQHKASLRGRQITENTEHWLLILLPLALLSCLVLPLLRASQSLSRQIARISS